MPVKLALLYCMQPKVLLLINSRHLELPVDWTAKLIPHDAKVDFIGIYSKFFVCLLDF